VLAGKRRSGEKTPERVPADPPPGRHPDRFPWRTLPAPGVFISPTSRKSSQRREVLLAPLAFPSHFLMGLCFGYLRTRSRSLYPGMLLHAAWNAFVLMAEFQS